MKLLEGIRVLEIARLLPGPNLTMLLADMGADVIKVEEPKLGDYLRIGRPEALGGRSPFFLYFNRNKRGISADFKTKEGLDVVYDVAKTCHVAVEGARPGASAKLGLGYEQLKAVNPKIVYCSITGFGQNGPFAQLASHGGAFDAVSGVAVPHELSDGSYVQNRPYPHGWTWGSWLGAMAICAAVGRAQATEQSIYLDISCADAALMALGQEILPVLLGQHEGWPDPEENPSAKYNYYRTMDDKFMLIAATEQHFWVNFCNAIDRPDLATRGDWSVSHMDSGHDADLRVELQSIFRTKTRDEWARFFVENNVAGAPYYPLGDVAGSELYQARQMVTQQQHPVAGKMPMVANAIKAEGDPFMVERPAPELGQHTDEVLKQIGYSPEKIADLKERGIIVQNDV